MADTGLSHIKEATSGRKLPQQDYTFATNDGLKLVYSVAGCGPLVIVEPPGWGIGKGYMEQQLAPLTEKYTLLFILPRGTEPSGRPADESRMGSSDMAEDLEALRAYIGVEKVSVLGHSNGAAIALAFASKYPSSVGKLILISTRLLGFDDSETFEKFAAARSQDPRYAPALAALPKAFGATTDDELRDGLVALMPYYFADPEKYVKPWQDMLRGSVVQVWPHLAQRKVDSKSPMPQLEKVTARTMITAGDEDAMCSVRTAERVKEGIPGAKLIVYKKCGHLPWEESKDKFFADVLAFLEA